VDPAGKCCQSCCHGELTSCHLSCASLASRCREEPCVSSWTPLCVHAEAGMCPWQALRKRGQCLVRYAGKIFAPEEAAARTSIDGDTGHPDVNCGPGAASWTSDVSSHHAGAHDMAKRHMRYARHCDAYIARASLSQEPVDRSAFTWVRMVFRFSGVCRSWLPATQEEPCSCGRHVQMHVLVRHHCKCVIHI